MFSKAGSGKCHPPHSTFFFKPQYNNARGHEFPNCFSAASRYNPACTISMSFTPLANLLRGAVFVIDHHGLVAWSDFPNDRFVRGWRATVKAPLQMPLDACRPAGSKPARFDKCGEVPQQLQAHGFGSIRRGNAPQRASSRPQDRKAAAPAAAIRSIAAQRGVYDWPCASMSRRSRGAGGRSRKRSVFPAKNRNGHCRKLSTEVGERTRCF